MDLILFLRLSLLVSISRKRSQDIPHDFDAAILAFHKNVIRSRSTPRSYPLQVNVATSYFFVGLKRQNVQ